MGAERLEFQLFVWFSGSMCFFFPEGIWKNTGDWMGLNREMKLKYSWDMGIMVGQNLDSRMMDGDLTWALEWRRVRVTMPKGRSFQNDPWSDLFWFGIDFNALQKQFSWAVRTEYVAQTKNTQLVCFVLNTIWESMVSTTPSSGMVNIPGTETLEFA